MPFQGILAHGGFVVAANMLLPDNDNGRRMVILKKICRNHCNHQGTVSAGQADPESNDTKRVDYDVVQSLSGPKCFQQFQCTRCSKMANSCQQ